MLDRNAFILIGVGALIGTWVLRLAMHKILPAQRNRDTPDADTEPAPAISIITLDDLPSVPVTGQEAKEQCVICLDPLSKENVSYGACLHKIHTSCLKEWLAKENSCPICREPLASAHSPRSIVEPIGNDVPASEVQSVIPIAPLVPETSTARNSALRGHDVPQQQLASPRQPTSPTPIHSRELQSDTGERATQELQQIAIG